MVKQVRQQHTMSDVASRERLSRIAREEGWEVDESAWRLLLCRRGEYTLRVVFNGSGTKEALLIRPGQINRHTGQPVMRTVAQVARSDKDKAKIVAALLRGNHGKPTGLPVPGFLKEAQQ